MTDRAQFEAMLEALINDDQQAAKEIFHNIVVGKSREIYEELLAEDFSRDTGNPYAEGAEEEEVPVEEDMEEEGAEEDDSEEDDSEDNPFGADDEEDSEEEPEDDGEEEPEDGEEDPFGGEEGGDIEDRVMDLEDALEDLKAEFEQLLAGEEHEEENEPGIHGDGAPMHDIEADMGGDMGGDDLEGLMEYTVKVPSPKHGDNGTNTRSLIDNMKNDMGGSNKNIAQNFSTTSGGTKGGLLAPSTKEENFGNVNVPGGKAGKTGFKTQVKGGGIDRQAGFNKPGTMAGAGTGKLSKDGEKNTKSLIGTKVR